MILENIFTLLMLVLLQAVLGIDNLLYISLESKNAIPEKQAYVRKMGIGLAILFRIALLFLLIQLIGIFQDPFVSFDVENIISATVNVHSLIVLAGGIFIIYIAVKEIWHMINVDLITDINQEIKQKSTGAIIAIIVVMNIVFSFDSILSAIALTDEIWVMTIAIIIGGALMIWLADSVSNFLKKNRMYEVLGLFILFLVGVMLLTEGGHLAHLHLFGNEIIPISKTTFYFIIFILVTIDVVQSKYKKKLLLLKEIEDSRD